MVVLLFCLVCAGVLGLVCPGARAQDDAVTKSNAIAVLGKPALPPDFPYFPYVNPNAPKGGEVRLAFGGTFDNFNSFILRGSGPLGLAGPWVILPGGSGSGSSVGHVFESLLTSSADEGDAAYGHPGADHRNAAEPAVGGLRHQSGSEILGRHAGDGRGRCMELQCLHDAGTPAVRVQFADVKDVEVTGERRVVFHFKSSENRELPLMVGGLPVFSKHFFEGRDFSRPLTDPPIGSGPYRIASFDMGRDIVFQRNPDWWARDLPTGKGTNNFDQVRIDYYRDLTVAMEAFKAGQVDLRSENTAARWHTPL